jgi:hypothetical protein
MLAPHDDSVELEPDVVPLRSRPEAPMEDGADFALAHDVDVPSYQCPEVPLLWR